MWGINLIKQKQFHKNFFNETNALIAEIGIKYVIVGIILQSLCKPRMIQVWNVEPAITLEKRHKNNQNHVYFQSKKLINWWHESSRALWDPGSSSGVAKWEWNLH